MDIAAVTGACGFVGSHMVDLLVEKGIMVHAMDLEQANKRWLRPHLDSGKAKFFPVNLTQKETLKEPLKDAAYVFHPAAVFDYSASWEWLESVNVGGTRNLCEVLVDYGKTKRLVNWSTAGVYGEPDPKLFPIKEDAPKGVNCNLYEKSKWLQEQLVHEFQAKQKLPVTSIRPAPIYGPRSIYGMAHVIFMIAKGSVPGIPVQAKGFAPFSNVKDICGAAYHVSQIDNALGEAYNVVDDSRITMFQFAHFVAPLVGADMLTLSLPLSHVKFWMTLGAKWTERVAKRRGTRPAIERETINYIVRSYQFSNEKLKSTGYKLLYPDVRVGLVETILWYQKEGFLP